MAERTKAPASVRDDYFAGLLAEPSSERGIGDKVRFDHSTGIWHIWNGVRWQPDKTQKIIDLVRNCAFKWIADAEGSGHDIKPLLPMLDAGRKASVLKMLASMPDIAMSGDEWDKDPELVGFENGVLNLRTLKLDKTPDPKLLVSRSTGYDWIEDDDYEVSMSMPFYDFVLDIMSGDAVLADYVIRVLGYSMIGVNQEQKFWMWVGGGSNGKGILARTVTKALGDYAYSPPDTLYMENKFGAARSDTARPELLKLQGARFTYMSEPQGGKLNEELLKAHSGNDPIEARTLYSARYKSFLPTHKIVFLTNEMLKTDDVGPSMRRRARVVKFLEDYSPESGRGDNTLEGRLQEDDNVRGALRIMAQAAHLYLKHNDLQEPQQVLDWSRAYIEENDPITAFINAMCVVDPQAEAQGGAMWKAFDAFAGANGYESLNMNSFGRAMQAKFARKSKASGNFYIGIRLKNTTDQAAEAGDDE